MDIRAQVAMVFHLDKCIGCHTCSIACKNIWTDRPGAEYMWWNNVETKPGTGFPTRWEDQLNYKGGWTVDGDGELKLRCQSKAAAFLKLFYNPNQPGLDDYYEPWTYQYDHLFNAPAGDDQPTARPVSLVTDEPMEIEAGPNWDDDLSGSPIYAEHDPNLDSLSEIDRTAMFEVERLSMMYLPRICNHCANPACVAACPSGALYKRGEDGVVLINQDVCRGWRNCITACPYKKIYFNWKTGKSEKCILCFPRLETGQAPACFHSCVGRIRYMGVLLYDADAIPSALGVPDARLVDAQRSLLLDPNDPAIARRAIACGISPAMVDAAKRSPVWRYVMEWRIALPLHAEFRTLPMLYYVPPLLPVMGRLGDDIYNHEPADLFAAVDQSRLPLRYFASLFSAGNLDIVKRVMRKLVAVRVAMRAKDLDDIPEERVARVLQEAGITAEQAEAIYRLTSLCPSSDRFVLPPLSREQAVGETPDCAQCHKAGCGFGPTKSPKRGA